MAQNSSPTVRVRQLGSMLRRYRLSAERSVQEVSEHLLCSPAKISRIETGQRAATLRDVRDLAEYYGISEQAEIDHLMALAREARQRGWWQQFDLNPELSTYVGLEAAASSIFEFQASFVPGLLQTPEYAAALIRGLMPDRGQAEVTSVVEARLTRQERLTEPGFSFWTVLDEAVLWHHVGDDDVMRGQLTTLVELAQSGRLTLQVIPFRTTSHPSLDSSFVLLDFEEEGVVSVVYLESLAGQFFLEQPADIQRYRRAGDRLRAVARSPEDSLRIITERIASI